MKSTKPAPKKPESAKKPDTPPAGKYRGTLNEYDSNRPKRQVMTRYSK